MPGYRYIERSIVSSLGTDAGQQYPGGIPPGCSQSVPCHSVLLLWDSHDITPHHAIFLFYTTNGSSGSRMPQCIHAALAVCHSLWRLNVSNCPAATTSGLVQRVSLGFESRARCLPSRPRCLGKWQLNVPMCLPRYISRY